MVVDDRKLINIAIDGHSSCGKSTLAKRLATELGYVYIDTGAMFRAIALFAIKKGMVVDGSVDVDRLVKALPEIAIDMKNVDGQMQLFLNDENVDDEIRSMAVSHIVSPVSTIKQVRQKLLDIQQKLGIHKGVIMDGRDIGTVVFPDAELKIFLTASAEIRAQRRTLELEERGQATPYDEVFKNLKERDYIDSNREIAPLRQAEDAILLDNSELSLEESIAFLRQSVRHVLNKHEQ